VQKALELDPHDPFNLIFANLSRRQRTERRGPRIAKENEGELSASYNLAAIYALLGNKEKAMDCSNATSTSTSASTKYGPWKCGRRGSTTSFCLDEDDPAFKELTKMAGNGHNESGGAASPSETAGARTFRPRFRPLMRSSSSMQSST